MLDTKMCMIGVPIILGASLLLGPLNKKSIYVYVCTHATYVFVYIDTARFLNAKEVCILILLWV